ncbi:energy transducer TonB [Anaerosinus massiliensis]|uniref:energy transducer TonB n=1 Tax=Massilibacillus massiliensis TaxID=1806837 RepID=UPI000DA612E0|nr:energy transducer TonB [Massilibacillus massiliensis]
MEEATRWRKAAIISLLMHACFLSVIGLLIAKTITMDEVPERYIEVELIGEISRDGTVMGNSVVGDAGSNKVSDMSATVSHASTLITEKVQTPSVVTDTHSLSVLATEPSAQSIGVSAAFASKGGGTADTGSGNGTGNGAGSGLGAGKGSSGTGSGRSGNGGGGINLPSIQSHVEPTYPDQAKQAGQEGTVVLQVQVLENGSTGNVVIYQSSGWRLLDDAAIEAVEQWSFNPAKERESGQAIVSYITVPMIFRLKT